MKPLCSNPMPSTRHRTLQEALAMLATLSEHESLRFKVAIPSLDEHVVTLPSKHLRDQEQVIVLDNAYILMSPFSFSMCIWLF